LVAVTSAKQYNDLEDLIAARRAEHSLIVVLDGIEDPHNLGAIIRTADAAGADGVVVPERRAASVTRHCGESFRWGERASSHRQGYEHFAFARRIEVERSVDRPAWTSVARKLTIKSTTKMHCAVVLGAEGKGLHDLVRKHCDFLVPFRCWARCRR